ncbi:MAG: helix-turn-helix domain-containing protein [Lachnospiraceae bacterium]
MADLNEKLSFFLELVNCNYRVGLWHVTSYDAEPEPVGSKAFFSFLPNHFSSEEDIRLLKEYMLTGDPNPVVLEYRIGILWIVGFTFVKESPVARNMYFLGPFFTGKPSRQAVLARLDQYSVSLPVRRQLADTLLDTAIMPFPRITQLAATLHKCLTEESIPASAVRTLGSIPDSETDESLSYSKTHGGVYNAEREFLRMIREGDSHYTEALNISSTISEGMRNQSVNSVRQAKNNVLVLLTLVSRAAMEGGLDSSVAYDMNDLYAARIESCQSVSETTLLSRWMVDDYVTRVRQHREPKGVSPLIQQTCDYIRAHLDTPLSIGELSDRIGYSKYYFSRRFHEETGMSVRAFILDQRLSRAHTLLLSTDQTVSEIAASLCLESRSYFLDAFRKKYGCTPGALRAGKA